MNKGALRDAVKTRNGIPTSGAGLVDSTSVDECVASALLDISAEQRWPWLLTSASLTFTTGTAPLPSDCLQIDKILVAGYPVREVSHDEFLQAANNYVFVQRGANVTIYPTPTTTLTSPTVWYYRDEPALATDSDSPLLPPSWHRVLVARASYHLNVRRPGEGDRLAIDENEWQAGLRRMRQTVDRSTGPKRIRSSFAQVRWANWR